MDRLSEIAPRGVRVTIGGRRWKLLPLRLADYATIERRATSESSDRARLTLAELDTWLRSRVGVLFEFWLRVRRRRPKLSLRAIERQLGAQMAEVAAALETAARSSGENPSGNLPRRCWLTRLAAASHLFGIQFTAAWSAPVCDQNRFRASRRRSCKPFWCRERQPGKRS